MWKIKLIDHENRNLKHYQVTNPHQSYRIYSNLGCSLQEMKIHGVEVIDGISNDEMGLEDYSKTFKSAILFPFPNRIENGAYSFNGLDYKLDCNDPLDNAIHGLVYDQEFSLVHEELTTENARLEFRYLSDASWVGYPFFYELVLAYCFLSSGGLQLEFRITNKGKVPMPFGIGWHPYFKTTNLSKSIMELPAKGHFPVTDQMIPIDREASKITGRFAVASTQLDDAFALTHGKCSLETDTYSLQMTFESEEEAYLQVYTPPHRESIAIEPMTCLANAFNNKTGLQTLKSGETGNWKVELHCKIKH